jgi:hypothetical protein
MKKHEALKPELKDLTTDCKGEQNSWPTVSFVIELVAHFLQYALGSISCFKHIAYGQMKALF